MCGIAGFTRFRKDIGSYATLLSMGDVIAHRGPDAHGEYLEGKIGLCHRRLSVIDLSESGNQPMVSSNGRYIIVFNGEIYNFQVLKKEAEKLGYVFKTHTDTEVILALYQYHGACVLDKLNGMFAFALWDIEKEKLFIARDRLGKKPLYYCYIDGELAFASELKSLLQLSGFSRKVRDDAVYDFFTYLYVPEPKTIFEGVYKLRPGHYIEVSAEGIIEEEYWDLSFENQEEQSEQCIIEELYGIIDQSVKSRMISDVPLGAFLSGGVDSSGVVAMMANAQSEPVTTCSIGFDSKKFDETKFAKIVADQYKTTHHELTVHSSVKDRLDHIVSFFDEPFADSSAVPTFFVSELARKKVTVAVAGDGGDESFAGYAKYSIDRVENDLRSKFPVAIRKGVFPSVASLLSVFNSTLTRKGATLLRALSLEPDYAFYLTNSFFDDLLWKQLINDDFGKKLDGYHPSDITTDYYRKADAEDHLSKVLYTDIKAYLPGDILVKVDRMSMANSLEVRAPLLDYKVVEYAARIPSKLKLSEYGDKKYILKEAFKPLLSDDILYRKKMGFVVPLAQWLREELREIAQEYIFAQDSGLREYFNMNIVQLMWDQHQSKKVDYATPLWSFLMFSMWWKNYMAEDSSESFHCSRGR